MQEKIHFFRNFPQLLRWRLPDFFHPAPSRQNRAAAEDTGTESRREFLRLFHKNRSSRCIRHYRLFSPLPASSASRKARFTALGSALPCSFFITWPTKKPSTF